MNRAVELLVRINSHLGGNVCNFDSVDSRVYRRWCREGKAPTPEPVARIAEEIWEKIHLPGAEDLRKSVLNEITSVDPGLRIGEMTATSLSAWFRQLAQEARNPLDYRDIFNIKGYVIPFIRLLPREENKQWRFEDISIIRSTTPFVLPAAFAKNPVPKGAKDLPSCRLENIPGEVNATGKRLKLEFKLGRVGYFDYIRSNEHIDDPLPTDRRRTFREEFGQIAHREDTSFRSFQLTNILGVGLFIVTKDHEVLITRHRNDSHVYPGRWTFSSSGTMRWGAHPHPFTEMLLNCRRETNHQINLERLALVQIGVDTRKLFFECCFVENSDATAAEIKDYLPTDLKYEMIPLDPVEKVVSKLVTECWEPSAEATLLMLCYKHCGPRAWKALEALRGDWKKHQMLDEWDLRASKPGSLAVMSGRYKAIKLEEESERYVGAVMQFLGNHILRKRVLEVGSGIGRITQRLARKAKHITCIDLCERMNERNRQQLGGLRAEVDIVKAFIQAFTPTETYDVAISSLVLIHNVDSTDFKEAVRAMCQCAKQVFVFEDTNSSRPTGPSTTIRPMEELIKAFKLNGFNLIAEESYDLFSDKIAFLRFEVG